MRQWRSWHGRRWGWRRSGLGRSWKWGTVADGILGDGGGTEAQAMDWDVGGAVVAEKRRPWARVLTVMG